MPWRNRLLWEGFRSWVTDSHPNDTHSLHSAMELINDFCAGVSPDMFSETLNLPSVSQVYVLFNEYKNFLGNRSDLAKFWITYLDMIEILLKLVRSSRERNWDMHLSAIHDMIPWCFAYDKINYAKYLSSYYVDMVRLPRTHPTAYEFLNNGGLSVQLSSSNPFGAIPVDQAMEETVMKDTQTAGGTKGFSLKSGTAQKYYINAEYRSLFLGNLRSMTRSYINAFHHGDVQI